MPGDTIQDYEKFKQENINPLERAGDLFRGVDERIDWLAPRILSALSETRAIDGKVDALAEAIANLPGGVIMPKIPEQIPFVLSLDIGQTLRLTEEMHVGGFIKQVTIHWADGCDALVDVMVGHDTVQFCPREGYLALNDITPTYPFNEAVNDNAGIWVEARNRDAGFPHDITVTVMVEGSA